MGLNQSVESTNNKLTMADPRAMKVLELNKDEIVRNGRIGLVAGATFGIVCSYIAYRQPRIRARKYINVLLGAMTFGYAFSGFGIGASLTVRNILDDYQNGKRRFLTEPVFEPVSEFEWKEQTKETKE